MDRSNHKPLTQRELDVLELSAMGRAKNGIQLPGVSLEDQERLGITSDAEKMRRLVREVVRLRMLVSAAGDRLTGTDPCPDCQKAQGSKHADGCSIPPILEEAERIQDER